MENGRRHHQRAEMFLHPDCGYPRDLMSETYGLRNSPSFVDRTIDLADRELVMTGSSNRNPDVRLIYYGVSDITRPTIDHWGAQHDVPVTCVSEELSQRTINLVKGHGAVCLYPSHELHDDESMYQRLHDYGVRQLSVAATGVDGINLQWADAYGLAVTNVPSYAPSSVAHFTVMAILMLLRGIPVYERNTSNWRAALGRELGDVTVGVMGTGRIGSLVAHSIHVLGGRVLACSPHSNPAIQGEVEYVDFPRLLSDSDVVTIHVPLTKDTTHMFSDEAFDRMKPDSCLVNTARGGIVDTEALIRALAAGKLGGVALDTLEDEERYFATGWTANPFYRQLTAYRNVLLTPHIAYYTQRAVSEITTTTLDNAFDYLSGRGTNNLIGARSHSSAQ